MTEDQAERIFIYRLLSRILCAPVDQPLLNYLASVEVTSEIEQNVLTDAWQQLALLAAGGGIAELDDEFHRLFIGLGRGELLPYRSYYETGFLMELPLAQLRADLLQLGFQRQQGNKEPEDFLSSLCEVMAMLISEEQHEDQCRFFQRHLDGWSDRFFTDMYKTSSAPFYQAVARLGQLFLKTESGAFRL